MAWAHREQREGSRQRESQAPYLPPSVVVGQSGVESSASEIIRNFFMERETRRGEEKDRNRVGSGRDKLNNLL